MTGYEIVHDSGYNDIPDDVIVTVSRDGAPVGRIICRYNDWNNEITYTLAMPQPGQQELPAWIPDYYAFDVLPDDVDYATAALYSFE